MAFIESRLVYRTSHQLERKFFGPIKMLAREASVFFVQRFFLLSGFSFFYAELIKYIQACIYIVINPNFFCQCTLITHSVTYKIIHNSCIRYACNILCHPENQMLYL